MIILHDIFHFEGYWSIFQSLICKLKPIFDAGQMTIFWSLLFGGHRLFWGQKLVKSKNDYILIERYWNDLNFIVKKFSPEINHYHQKKSFFAVSINMNHPVQNDSSAKQSIGLFQPGPIRTDLTPHPCKTERNFSFDIQYLLLY